MRKLAGKMAGRGWQEGGVPPCLALSKFYAKFELTFNDFFCTYLHLICIQFLTFCFFMVTLFFGGKEVVRGLQFLVFMLKIVA